MEKGFSAISNSGQAHSLTCWIFLRLLGFVYFCAFSSWAMQATGLVGEHGILPCRQFIDSLPATIFWFNTSDFFLASVPWLGSLLSLAFTIGFLSGPCSIILFVLYLSIVNVGMDFTGFQWDALLLETGFIAIFLSPWKLQEKLPPANAPSIAILWLLRFLTFRLMFMSGFVKLASGDPAWRNLTAICYHYETQPLPTPLAWYLNQLPEWFQRISTGSVLLIELAGPFLIFGPRKARLAAAAILIFLQILIALSGNYAFFNLLTMALCLTLLDDKAIQAILPGTKAWPPKIEQKKSKWKTPGAVLLAILATSQTIMQASNYQIAPAPMLLVLTAIQPFHIINNYGLFAVMTTSRPEIIIEGSNDGQKWLAYEFRYKSGELGRGLPIIAPYQPRLDWQMWFAALGTSAQNPWFQSFAERLLEGQPDVIALLEKNPFPKEKPPVFLRASIYNYHFTNQTSKNKTGNWWRRDFKEIYLPVVSLREIKSPD